MVFEVFLGQLVLMVQREPTPRADLLFTSVVVEQPIALKQLLQVRNFLRTLVRIADKLSLRFQGFSQHHRALLNSLFAEGSQTWVVKCVLFIGAAPNEQTPYVIEDVG